MAGPVTIYIVSDGKPGHLSQSRGLAQAIARRVGVTVTEVDARDKANWPSSRPEGLSLVIAAGRAAVDAALSLKSRWGVPTVALMNPGWLSRRRLDLCVIPRHDGVAASDKVIVTEGALNTIAPAVDASLDEGLILMGGPSKHYGWDADGPRTQVETVLQKTPTMRWTATGSRRTPEATHLDLQEMAHRSAGQLTYLPASDTPQGWVAEQLRRCGVVWVSEDSVSMVYESLTAGAWVGLLPVLRKTGRPGRVVRGIESLIQRGWVTPFAAWRDDEPFTVDRPPLAEADRVAEQILERWGQRWD